MIVIQIQTTDGEAYSLQVGSGYDTTPDSEGHRLLYGHSKRWWATTKRMVRRGYARCAKKYGWVEDPYRPFHFGQKSD